VKSWSLVLALLVMLAPFAGVTAGDKVYRWVDAEGKVQFGDRPPPETGAAEVKIRSFSGEAEVDDAGRVSGNEVVMYSTARCPYCRRAREHLTKKGIPFSEWDIETNPYARAEYSTLKGRGVPLILVGKQRISGFNGPRLDKMLEKAGYVTKGREPRR